MLSLRTSSARLDRPRPDTCFARDEREPQMGAPACPMSLRSELESGAGGHHRRAAGAHGRDDLLRVDPLQVDRRGAEIHMPQLALDDVQRYALAGELERVRVAQLVRREPPPGAGPGSDPPELAAHGGARPRSPARRAVDDAEQRPDWELGAGAEPRP